MSTDRNLLFGMLALHNGFVSREQLLAAFNQWMLAKDVALGTILRAQGILTDEDAQMLDELLRRHVRKHGDVQRSLGSLRIEAEVRSDLARLPDGDVQASVASLGTPLVHSPLEPPGSTVPETVYPPPPSAPPWSGLRYRKTRFHDKGGLGEVWVALDEELQREVALKEIQDRFADNLVDRKRFVREAKLTGHLEHPGIVPVYGLVEMPDGRPVYAMRFIHGTSLHEAIKRFHEGKNNDGGLTLRALLTRFVAVCNAVAYAHSRGVIHRDLKPANVMLGDFGETLVVDWGLARLHQEADSTSATVRELLQADGDLARTQWGAAVGTLAYMPPEQARGEHEQVGSRSDVFALGATLYALLTGQAPYVGADLVLRARRGDFPPPRQVRPDVPKALEAVCLKAMAERPEHRYATAQAVAEEVERYLADEPVSAYHEPMSEQVRRWSRKHRSVVSGAMVLLATSVVGLSVGLWAVGREQAETQKQRDEAQANLRRAREAEKEATANFAQARKAVDECFNVCKEHPLFQEPRMERARKLLLQQTKPFYETFRARRPDDPKMRFEEAEQHFRVAYIERQLGNVEAGLQQCRQALEIYTELSAAHPGNVEYQKERARTQHNLCEHLTVSGRHAEALKEYDRAGKFFVELVKANPKEPALEMDLAMHHNNLGNLLKDLGRNEEAKQEFLKARALHARLKKVDPELPGLQEQVGHNHVHLANVLANLRQREEALREFQQGRDVFARLVRAHPNEAILQTYLAGAQNNLGGLLSAMGRGEEAWNEYRSALTVKERLARINPDIPDLQLDLAGTHYNLGILLARLSKPEEALKHYSAALETLGPVARANPKLVLLQQTLAAIHQNLGNLHKQQSRNEQALREFEQALVIKELLVKAQPELPSYRVELARTRIACGVVLALMQRWKESREHLDPGVALLDQLDEKTSRDPGVLSLLTLALPIRAEVLARLGSREPADADWERFLNLTPSDQQVFVRLQRADSRARSGDYSRAADEAEELARVEALSGGVAAYSLSRVFANCASAVGRDVQRPLSVRDKERERYARRAVGLLRGAANAGLFRDPAYRAHLDKDADLDVLRERADFRDVVRVLASGQP